MVLVNATVAAVNQYCYKGHDGILICFDVSIFNLLHSLQDEG